MADPELEVTEEDMIMTRTRTTGIVVTEFSDKPYTLVTLVFVSLA